LREKLEVQVEERQLAYIRGLLAVELLWAGMSSTAHSSFARRATGSIGSGLTMASRHPKTVMGAAAGGIGYAGYRSKRGSQNNPLIGLE
jgi:hypothetical protein